MKKLGTIALVLAACLSLSACDDIENTTPDPTSTTSNENIVHQPNIDEIMSNTAAGNYGDNSTDSTANETSDEKNIELTKPEIPQVEAISPSKLEYEFYEGDYGPGILITAISTAAEQIRFPDTIDGEPVVYIHYKMKYSGNVKTLIFPDTVASCGSIPKTVEFVKLPKGINEIKEDMFRGCSKLESVYIPDGISSIEDSAFSNCSNLTNITLPNSLSSIEDSAFSNCSNLSSITLPNSLSSIGAGAFRDCSSLTSITLPNSLSSIGESAFSGCSNLTSITLPDGVDEIGYRVFEYGCSSLNSISYKGKTYTLSEWEEEFG